MVSGSVTATGTDGKGGDIEILGKYVELTGQVLVDASVEAAAVPY